LPTPKYENPKALFPNLFNKNLTLFTPKLCNADETKGIKIVTVTAEIKTILTNENFYIGNARHD